MDLKETVTMYQISKELALECNYDFVKKDDNGNIKIVEDKRNVFENYKKEQVKKLTELLKVKGVEKNAIKNEQEFAIPVDSKEYIKYLLLNFTSKSVKAIRKTGLESLPYTQWSELVNGLVEYSTKDIKDSSQKEKKRLEIFAQHQYFSIERHNCLIDKFSLLLKEAELRYGTFDNLGNENSSTQKKGTYEVNNSSDEIYNFDDADYNARLLSENDVIELYGYLEKKIYQCFIEFGEVADIFSEIRHEDIEDKVIQAIDENENPDDITYDDSKIVLEKALREFQK
ncbi:hypothetical protein FZC78_09500 [Rossellomorea vietnamensis]|uniref:Uncharacterized protein n=1 Tax=Rossellomorea vietnamensis TaxID=218284 RepID=A0A5D4NZI8_9BACI|nr:hypothetical protein [Rossellomorea vietnamensis]TYS18052.1 hypothetical protein FZC78_09500 [Rossellomorea vietnamensis]